MAYVAIMTCKVFLQCLFEIPLPQLASHVGARRADFVKILEDLRALLSTLCCIEDIHVQAAGEIGGNLDIQGLQYTLAMISSCLAHMSYALALVKTSKYCKGSKAPWKPRAPQFWEGLEDAVRSLASSASAAAINDPMPISSRGRDFILFVMNVESFVGDIRQCEQSIARALDIPNPDNKCEEKEKVGLKEKIFGNAYLPSILVHTALISGGAVYALVVISLVKLLKGSKAFLKSREERIKSTLIELYPMSC